MTPVSEHYSMYESKQENGNCISHMNEWFIYSVALSHAQSAQTRVNVYYDHYFQSTLKVKTI